MADRFMYIPNYDTQKYPFWRLQLKRLETQPNEQTNQNSIKDPKIVKPTNKQQVS